LPAKHEKRGNCANVKEHHENCGVPVKARSLVKIARFISHSNSKVPKIHASFAQGAAFAGLLRRKCGHSVSAAH
jgi:hypothetical protein